MTVLIDKLREAFAFKRTPDELGDGGAAFVGFLNFASGDSEQAHKLQALYFQDTGRHAHDDKRATPAEVGQYIDWLIETQWGAASPPLMKEAE
jgi:hypothetical protein